MNRLRMERLALAVLVSALTGACAGGGGGGSYGGGGFVPPPPPPTTLTPGPPPVAPPPAPPLVPPGTTPDTSSAEFGNNWGIGGVGAQWAWRREGGTGEGVTIAVIDDGVDPNHPELTGRISPASKDINAARNALTTSLSHGSELSSLIAGNFNGQQTVGVAYEATILAVRTDNGQGSFFDADLAAAVNYAVDQGVDIINFSLGSSAQSSPAFRDALQRATQAGIIVVASAGNDGRYGADQVNYPGYHANVPTVSNGLIIVAGGLNADGSVNRVSNPPGAAANFYLVAPGWEIIVPDFGPSGPVPGFQQCWPNPNSCSGLVEIQGTSYASPLTAGAIAVLMSAFPSLTPQQVVALVLSSTDDVGEPGVDSLTGRGRLNLQRAFEPVGTVAAPLSSGFTATAGLPLGVAGPAFGDGFTDDPGEWVVAGFDAYGRTYDLNLASNWLMSAGGPRLSASAPLLWRSASDVEGVRMEFAPAEDVAPDSLRLPIAREDVERASMRVEAELAAGFTLGFATQGLAAAETDASRTQGHMGFVGADMSLRLARKLSDNFSVALTSESGAARVGLSQDWSERRGSALEAAYERGRFGLSASFGQVRESEGVLGFAWTDGLGDTPGAEARFAGLAGHVDLSSRLRLRVAGETGVAELSRSGWLSLDEPLTTSAFSAELAYALAPAWIEDAGGQLVFSVSQPLRVEEGGFIVMAPNANRFGRKSLSYEARRVDVAPSGREMQFGASYRLFVSDVLSAFGEAVYATEPGHVSAADDAALVRLGLRARY